MGSSFKKHKDQILDWVDTGGLPGVSHLVMQGGEVLEETYCGYSDVESSSEITSSSLFRLASATKYFVSLLFLRLIDQGRLNFDDNLADYFPEFGSFSLFDQGGAIKKAEKIITLEDLARHSQGYTYGEKEPFRSAMIKAGLMKKGALGSDWSHSSNLTQWMKALSEVPVEHEAGIAVSYGLGHDMLGAVIERVVGKRLDQCMAEEVVEPLNLTSTFFVVPAERGSDLTSMYSYGGKLERLETGLESLFLQPPKAFSGGGGWDMLGNGGLVTNALDFARVLQLILNNGMFEGQAFLQANTAARLASNRTQGIGEILPGHGYSYGIGYQNKSRVLSDRGGKGKLWWGGSTNPYFFVDPANDLLSIYLTHTFPFGHLDAAYTLERMTYQMINQNS